VNLLIDGNIARPIIERLRLDGHTLTLAVDVALGQPDTEILAWSRRLGAPVVTEDTDFGELVMHQRVPSAGVIPLRLSGMVRGAQPDYVAQMLDAHASSLPDHFTVLMPASVRIRPLP
jgi:predicted nuclease of predicted toxin-antitoxin system